MSTVNGRMRERGGGGGGGKKREGGRRGAGGAKSRTQLTNTEKIPSNEDGQSSRDPARRRGE